MAIVATRADGTVANPGAATLSLRMMDARSNDFTVSLKVVPGITDAQVSAIITAVENISNAKSCGWGLTIPGAITGNKAAATAVMYADRYTQARIHFASVADCRERVNIQVGAPLEAIFTGIENRILNTSNALVLALAAALNGVLANSMGETDFTLNGGYRDTKAASAPVI